MKNFRSSLCQNNSNDSSCFIFRDSAALNTETPQPISNEDDLVTSQPVDQSQDRTDSPPLVSSPIPETAAVNETSSPCDPSEAADRAISPDTDPSNGTMGKKGKKKKKWPGMNHEVDIPKSHIGQYWYLFETFRALQSSHLILSCSSVVISKIGKKKKRKSVTLSKRFNLFLFV